MQNVKKPCESEKQEVREAEAEVRVTTPQKWVDWGQKDRK